MPRQTSRRRVRAGFTMIELLTVIGIIVVLIAILLPVVASVQRKAREADTSAQINRLATAAQNYYNDYRAYPGPVPDDKISGDRGRPNPNPNISGITVVTASENFLLGILGGLFATPGAPGKPAVITFDPKLVGKGPQSLNPLTPKQSSPYTDLNASELPPLVVGGSTYMDYASMGGAGTGANPDSVIPEFFDHFSTPKPLIYLRARVGAPDIVYMAGIASPQYSSQEMSPYGFAFPTQADPDTGVPRYNAPVDFFKHPTINDGHTPRNKDTFILMSAGADGIWGTKDDIIYSN